MTEDDRQPLSEDAALRELENLQRAIEQSRLRRKEANEAFDRFLRSFDQPAAAKPQAVPAPRPAPGQPPAPAVQPQTAAPPQPVPPASAPPVGAAPPAPAPQPVKSFTPIDPVPPLFSPGDASRQPDVLDLDDWEQQAAESPGSSSSDALAPAPARSSVPEESPVVPAAFNADVRPHSRKALAAALAALLVTAVVGFLFWTAGKDDGGSTQRTTAEEPAAAPQSVPAPAAAPPEPAAPPPPAEIITLRTVWIRVLVDGQKVVERELPANTHVPLQPKSGFVLRAGDAGGVRVEIAGKDQGPIGRDGHPATKVFNMGVK